MIRPSSLPALAQCPCFESGSSEYTDDGTERHAALSEHFAGDNGRLDLMDEEQAEAVKWAADYIRLHAPMSDHSIQFETKLSVMLEVDLEEFELKGTPDAVCGNDLFDLKTRPRDYVPQMAAYALMMFDQAPERPFVRVHLLFAALRKHETFKLTREAAVKIVVPIVANSLDSNRVPKPCDYCNWCANKLTCSAIKDRVQAVQSGREDWELEQYNTSFISEPAEMAKALRVARLLAKWCEAVEFRAKTMWIKEGMAIPGFKLQERAGKSVITDVLEAFRLSGLPEETFLKCCDLRMETSKKFPEKVGAVNAYRELTGVTMAAAKRELKRKLEPVTRRGNPTVSIVADKGETLEEEDNG